MARSGAAARIAACGWITGPPGTPPPGMFSSNVSAMPVPPPPSPIGSFPTSLMVSSISSLRVSNGSPSGCRRRRRSPSACRTGGSLSVSSGGGLSSGGSFSVSKGGCLSSVSDGLSWTVSAGTCPAAGTWPGRGGRAHSRLRLDHRAAGNTAPGIFSDERSRRCRCLPPPSKIGSFASSLRVSLIDSLKVSSVSSLRVSTGPSLSVSKVGCLSSGGGLSWGGSFSVSKGGCLSSGGSLSNGGNLSRAGTCRRGGNLSNGGAFSSGGGFRPPPAPAPDRARRRARRRAARR